MYKKEEAKQLREEFWLSFGKSFPRKWVLYDTKIKGLSLKFHFDKTKAMVSLDIELHDLGRRIELWDKLVSLRTILTNDYLPEALFEDSYILTNQKEVSRLYIQKNEVSIHNKHTWQETMVFLNTNMLHLEKFFLDFEGTLSS